MMSATATTTGGDKRGANRNGHTAPSTLAVRLDGIPESLRAIPSWVAWKWAFRRDKQGNGGKWTKPPFQARGTDVTHYARSTDPTTWNPFPLAMLASRQPDVAGIGYVFTSQAGVIGIDLDHCRDRESGIIETWAVEILAKFTNTYAEVSPSGTGIHIYARVQLPADAAGLKKGPIEIYPHSRFFAVTGHRLPDAPAEVAECQQAVLDLYAQLQLGGETLRPIADEPQAGESNGKPRSRKSKEPTDDEILAKARAAANGSEFSTLWAGTWQGAYASQSEADQALCNMLAFWTGPDADRIDRLFRLSGLMRPKWDERHYGSGDSYGAGTIKKALEGRTEFFRWAGKRKRASKKTAAVAGQNLTDLGNAERLVAYHGQDLRFCWPWSKWLVWDDRRWIEDQTGAVFAKAKQTVRRMFIEAANVEDQDEREALAKHALRSEDSRRINAMVEKARSEPGIPVLPADMDRDQWLFGCRNGVIDLRTGNLLPHERGRLVTKLSQINYNPGADYDLWGRSMQRWFAGNTALIDFLQRLTGHWLTGDVSEQILSIFWGVGANGKNTLLTAITDILGDDYSMWAASELVMIRKQPGHPTEKMDLFGKRLVIASEPEAGCRLAESWVKQLTGGDRIRGRRCYEDPWEFAPTHKVVLVTNHKPRIQGTDVAIWRRIRLVPFTVVIPDAERDKQLPAKLKAEYEGILAWMVRGCLEWQRRGLGEPQAVVDATKKYRSEEDQLGGFLDECCYVNPTVMIKAKDLYRCYTQYAEGAREAVLSQTAFGAAMTERGFERRKSNGVWYIGVALLTE